MLKYKSRKVVTLSDWDNLVEATYGRPYDFQQQDGCKDRGTFEFSVPNFEDVDEYADPDISVDVGFMGVSFATWISRNPTEPVDGVKFLDLWWLRKFYPDVQMIANDLHKRGLLEAGEYTIDIDW